jgi:hypothetical protein
MSAATAPASMKDQLATHRFSLLPELDTPELAASLTTRDDESVARLAYAHWEERLKNNIEGSAEGKWS